MSGSISAKGKRAKRFEDKKTEGRKPFGLFAWFGNYFAALAARMASVSSGVTLNRSPQMP